MAKSALAEVKSGSTVNTLDDVSPGSMEIIIALSGLAGSGCSIISGQMETLLTAKGYEVHLIKVSNLIEDKTADEIPKVPNSGPKGAARLERAIALQNAGDDLRKIFGDYALTSFAIEQIKSLRGDKQAGGSKLAFIIDSLKHPDEVLLFRKAYDQSFRLLAVHCDQENREKRLLGNSTAQVKFAGADEEKVKSFIKRDENDSSKKNGQHVKDVFHQADFFLDNSTPAPLAGLAANPYLDRFFDLILGNGVYRPTIGEKAIYHAFGAALQSSCLSRQVGACLVSPDGQIIALGTNDPPKFGGGIYQENDKPDNRCMKFKFDNEAIEYTGCHNDRKKENLRKEIAAWAKSDLLPKLASSMFKKPDEETKKQNAQNLMINAVSEIDSIFTNIPGISSLIEFSRSIHAEMDAILSASREGISTVGCDLYVTTYPCHSCARHLVAAGIRRVYYVEPYIKSLALELHSDAITSALPKIEGDVIRQMVIAPFTGVGPTMYQESFLKKAELKKADGKFEGPSNGLPVSAVRLKDLESVEDRAIDLAQNGSPAAND